MTEKESDSGKGVSPDWFLRGALTKIGDTFDRLTGRRWVPSSSIATSELVERIKSLLDAEAKRIPGKGTVVPHNIKLKIQWDKFSTDADDSLDKLKNELLTAAADHINDALYYTYAPLVLEVKPDYFTEGVKLFVSFDKFADDEPDVEMNVTVPLINKTDLPVLPSPDGSGITETFIARFELRGSRRDKQLVLSAGSRLAVGRTGGNDLAIDDPSVSKIHASLVMDREGHLTVADTGSTNGTFINDQRISYGKATHLVDGDRVKFGTVEVVFERIPKTIEAKTDGEINSKAETVAIDDFEFTSRPSLPEPDTTAEAVTLRDEKPNMETDAGEDENSDKGPTSDPHVNK